MAQEYLAQQGVEKALAEAVARVIQEKPSNAVARIAQILSAPDASIPLGMWNIISAHLPADAPPFTFTSTVVGPGKIFPDLNWQTTAWLVPHESLRWLMSLTKYITTHKNFDVSDSKRAAALQVFFDDFYYPYVLSHHSAEDAVCGKHWPEVYGAGGMIGSQHVQVDDLMKDMKAAVADLVAGKDALGAGKTFVVKHTELCNLLGPHLEFEERETPAVLEKWGKGEDEFNKVIGTELVPFDIEMGTKTFGPEKYFGEIFPALMAVVQAAMAEWGGAERTRNAMWNVMPPPVQESYLANGVKAVHRLIVAPVIACTAP